MCLLEEVSENIYLLFVNGAPADTPLVLYKNYICSTDGRSHCRTQCYTLITGIKSNETKVRAAPTKMCGVFTTSLHTVKMYSVCRVITSRMQ